MTRAVSACALLAAISAATPAMARHAKVPAPVITVVPTSVTPHCVVQVRGTGFDPSLSGKQVTVAVSVQTTAGTFPIGSLPTDSGGNVGGASGMSLTLPFSIDALGVDQVIASEVGNAGLGATQLITGTGLHPMVGGGMTIVGTAGSQMTIHGSGFAPFDTVAVTVGGHDLPAGAVTNTTADVAGNIALLISLPLDWQSGRQLLMVKGSATGSGVTDSASATLNVLAPPGSVAIAPNPAQVGTSVTAEANGFQASEPVTFSLRYYDTGLNSYAMVNTPTDADSSGTATAQVNIPPQADPTRGGSIQARGVTSGATASGTLTFAANATLSISPADAVPGSQVTVVGAGFVPRENLFVTTRLFKPPVGTFGTPGATGTFTSTVTLLPTLQPGTSYSLSISGTGGDNATMTYRIGTPIPPGFGVSPSDSWPGAFLAASGQGFGGSEPVTLSISGTALSVQGPPPVTDATGAFTATVVLPLGIAPGTYTMQAQGMQSNTVRNASINVTLKPSSQWYFAEGFTGQGPSVFFHETLTLLNVQNAPATGTITYQLPDGSTRSVPVSLGAHCVVSEDVNSDVGSNKIVSAVVKASVPIYAERTITRTNAQKQTLDSDVSPGQPSPQSIWYFAEGYSGVTFQPYLTVLNPFSEPVSMTVTLYPTVGTPVVVPATLVPFGRYTLNLRGVLPGKSFSTSVVADQPVVAERVEYWGDGVGSAKFGAGVKPGISSPGQDWYFGYGSILLGDQSFISLVDPVTQTAHLTATVFAGSGAMTTPLTLTVQPGQRGTFEMDKLLAGANQSPIAVHLESDTPVIAEEAQYYGGSPNVGSHTGASIEGRQVASGQWTFASGDTSQNNESEYIFNPSSVPTTVSATFYGADGQVVTASYAAPAQSVVTVSANAVKGLHSQAHGSVWSAAKNAKVVVVQVLLRKDGRAALADQGIPG
jgi:hypothetical protein